MDSKNKLVIFIGLPLMAYFEKLCNLCGIQIPLLKIFLYYYHSKNKYFDKIDNENAYNIYCKIKNAKNADFIKEKPEILSVSCLFELIHILINSKIELESSVLLNYLQQLIINLKIEYYKINEIHYKKDKNINSIQIIDNKLEENKYNAVIRAKLFNLLIDYINNNYYDADNERKLNEIKQMNNVIIKNNINIFYELNLDYKEADIESKDILDIYLDIILAIIKNKYNYKYAENILKQLDIENIYNKTLFNKLDNILEKDYIKQNLIEKKDDLFDPQKIYFYYIMLKYIFKKPVYKFSTILMKTKIIILDLLKSNELFKDNINIDFRDKIFYVITTLCDSEDYVKEIPKEDEEKLKEVLHYYEKYLFDSKKQDIIIIRNIIKYNMGNFKEYLKDYEKSKKYNLLLKMIEYLNKIKNNENFRTENEINQTVVSFEERISKKQLNTICLDDKQILIKYFMDEKQSLLQIFQKEIYEYFINSVIVTLLLKESIITFYRDKTEDIKIVFGKYNNKITFQEINVIKEGLINNNKEYDGNLINDLKIFCQFLTKFKEEIFNEIKNERVCSIKLKFKNNSDSIDNYISNAEIGGFLKFNGIFTEELKVKIREFIKNIIKDVKEDAKKDVKKDVEIQKQNSNDSTFINSENRDDKKYEEIIIKLSNGYYIAKELDKSYIIIDNSFSKKLKINLNEISYISEIECIRIIDYIPLIIVSNNKINICKYNKDHNSLDINCINDLIFDKNDYIININENELIACMKNQLYHLNNISYKIEDIETKLVEKKEEELDKIVKKDELKLFEINLKIDAIKGYSLINKKNKLIYNNKVLICSCKEGNQNGILIKFLNHKEVFINTNDFEPLCFYPCFDKKKLFVGGNENGGKIVLYPMDFNNYSIKKEGNLVNTERGGAIINLLKIQNNNLYYFQDNKIKSMTL